MKKCHNSRTDPFPNEPNALDIITLEAWQEIDQGIKQGDSSMIEMGNMALLYREQHSTLAPGYSALSSLPLSSALTAIVSFLAKSPVAPQSLGLDFDTVVPNGNLFNFDDRWNWIADPVAGIWYSWIIQSPSQSQSLVSTSLLTRAALFAKFPLN